MTNIKNLIKAINEELMTAEGTIYTENDEVEVKKALSLLSKEIERLQKFENKINEKEKLEDLAVELSVEKEGQFSGLKYTKTDDEGVSVEVYCDFWDFDGGTNDYYYTWDYLRELSD